jgi:hypothetical protein
MLLVVLCASACHINDNVWKQLKMVGDLIKRPNTSPERCDRSLPGLRRMNDNPGAFKSSLRRKQTNTCNSQRDYQGHSPDARRVPVPDASSSYSTLVELQLRSPACQRRKRANLPVFQAPHQSHQLRNSGAKLVRDLTERIEQHCPPSHNWDFRRHELQISIGMCCLIL